MYLRQSQETGSLQKVDIAEAIPQSSEAVFTGKRMKNFLEPLYSYFMLHPHKSPEPE